MPFHRNKTSWFQNCPAAGLKYVYSLTSTYCEDSNFIGDEMVHFDLMGAIYCKMKEHQLLKVFFSSLFGDWLAVFSRQFEDRYPCNLYNLVMEVIMLFLLSQDFRRDIV